MKFFTKEETLVVSAVLALIITVSIPNFAVSIRRARDAQRKNDVGVLANALAKFRDDFGSFPLSSPNGEVMACNPRISQVGKKVEVIFDACSWGKDALKDPFDPSYPAYTPVLPIDPKDEGGIKYFYISNGKRFQLLAHLEGSDEAEYDPKILARNVSCGSKICSFGRASGSTPLDKSIEEYENELLDKNGGTGDEID